MDFNNKNLIGPYKECAGRGCSKKGVNHLKILFVNRSGWFCDSCKDTLVSNGLADEAIKESE